MSLDHIQSSNATWKSRWQTRWLYCTWIIILEQTTSTYTLLFWYEDDKGERHKKHFNSKAEPTGPIGHEPSLHCGMPNTQHVHTIPKCKTILFTNSGLVGPCQSCLGILFILGRLKKIWCSAWTMRLEYISGRLLMWWQMSCPFAVHRLQCWLTLARNYFHNLELYIIDYVLLTMAM